MTTPDNEIGSTGRPRKHFFKVPEGIQDFTEEQIYAFAESMYKQIVQSPSDIQTPEIFQGSGEENPKEES